MTESLCTVLYEPVFNPPRGPLTPLTRLDPLHTDSPRNMLDPWIIFLTDTKRSTAANTCTVFISGRSELLHCCLSLSS